MAIGKDSAINYKKKSLFLASIVFPAGFPWSDGMQSGRDCVCWQTEKSFTVSHIILYELLHIL